MKLLSTIGVVAIAGAVAARAAESDSCCAPVAAKPANVYVAVANPPGPTETTGKASGRIVFEGEKPELKPADISAEAAKGCVEGGMPDSADRSLLVDGSKGLANVVVMVKVPDAQVKAPEKPIVLDQMQCRYEPRITVVPAGATVEYHNSDKVSHNVHTYATKNESFNKTIAAGAKDSQKLEKVEQIEVKCDIHPWMKSWLVVSDLPHVAVTKADGSFEIAGLKPGEYDVQLWHERCGKGNGKVKINDDGTSTPVEIAMGEGKKAGGGKRR